MPPKRLGWQAQVETRSRFMERRLEPLKRSGVRAHGIVMALLAAAGLAAVALYAVPGAVEMLAGIDDPARIAHHAINDKFDAQVAGREIEAALAAGDADLARSFVDLAADRGVVLDPLLVERVNAATAEAATTRHKAKSFARGLVSGEPDDMAALAGTAVGDLFVFGDKIGRASG